MVQGQQGQKSKGGGGAKIGRNRVECERYRAQGRREKNKRRKLQKHIKRCPGDLAAQKALG